AVRIPGAAAETTGRMAGPPGEPDAALELIAMLPQNARDLDHGGIAGRVVADTDLPRVVVAMQQDELLGVLRAADLDHRQLALEPAFARIRDEPRRAAGF